MPTECILRPAALNEKLESLCIYSDLFSILKKKKKQKILKGISLATSVQNTVQRSTLAMTKFILFINHSQRFGAKMQKEKKKKNVEKGRDRTEHIRVFERTLFFMFSRTWFPRNFYLVFQCECNRINYPLL